MATKTAVTTAIAKTAKKLQSNHPKKQLPKSSTFIA
jgi:hypothetical protein